MKTRLARFNNLPELMSMFQQAADIQTADTLHLPVPDLTGGKPVDVQLKPSEIQKQMVQALSKRADKVRKGDVDPHMDNMLAITNDGRKLALDQRLMNPLLPDDPNSKVNACMENVYRVWNETKADRLTQLVFSDLSTPGKGGFNVYDDLKAKLIERGIPPEEIAYIHDAKTETQKAELFGRVRNGAVRILIGSTAKMGAGTNVQRKLVALHHLDVPWRPADIEQREGRMIRQGNENKEVTVFRYVTEDTFDAYSWQLIENKQRFISQVMTSKSPARSCDDMDEAALSYAEIKALAAGNPMIKEKMDLDIQVTRLRALKAEYDSQRFRLEDMLTLHWPAEIRNEQNQLTAYKADAQTVAANTKREEKGEAVFSMTLDGKTHEKREDAGRALLGLLGSAMGCEESAPVGSYLGLELRVQYNAVDKVFYALLVGQTTYRMELGADAVGNIMRIQNRANAIESFANGCEERIRDIEHQMQNAREELQHPFEQEQELAEKSRRLEELNALLDVTGKDQSLDTAEDEPEIAGVSTVMDEPER